MSGRLDIAVRALAVPADPGTRRRKGGRPRPSGRPSPDRFPSYALIFDTETTIDERQQLNFAAWRYCRVAIEAGEVVFTCVAEGLVYDDGLPERDPDGYRALIEYAGSREAWVGRGPLDARPGLSAEPLRRWLDQVFWPAAYKLGAAVVCFNAPFDLSRLAWQVGATRTYKPNERSDAFEGGFSFALWWRDLEGERAESRFRPRLAIKSIDSKRSLKGFRSPNLNPDGAAPAGAEGVRFRGHFLDLRTLVFALTDKSHSLESASRAFGVPYAKREVEHGRISAEYIDYCREDVHATERLCERALTEFLRHPIPLQATRAYSPATLGKAYLAQMGVTPPEGRHDIDRRTLGWAMSAYYGGRAECRIRRRPVPVVYLDFKSMYPTVCALMDLWALLTAERIEAVDATREVEQLLEDIDADACFDPATWPGFVGIAQLIPEGEVLPVRGRYGPGPSWQIGVNPLTSAEPMWFTIADLVASKFLTGKTPKILRAIRFVGRGRLSDLRPESLLGAADVDPATRDFFRTVIEQRTIAKDRGDENASKGLKTLANATSYGIYAQMTRRELGERRRERVTVYGGRDAPHECRVANPEEAGEYTFPPVAAAITGAARLLLALLEHQVAQAGGTHAFCDTDSMAIVSTHRGDLVACEGGPHDDGRAAIRALSYDDVEQIRERFAALNPYDREIVPGSILELEDENFADAARTERRQLHCYAISAKRYTFYVETPDGPILVKPSQHGLGHLLNPTDPGSEDRDWIADVWRWLLGDALGLPTEEPAWLDRPAVGRLTVSGPRLHRLLGTLNAGRPYGEQIKPFNFLLIAFVSPLERPADEQRLVLIAPYSGDPAAWCETPWLNRYSAKPYRITTVPSGGYERDGVVSVKTYRDLLADYATHPESKSSDSGGAPCGRRTRGLLRRRPVIERTITHIGKESNALEEAQAGLYDRQDDLLNAYDDTERLVFEAETLPRLRDLGVREVARRTGHSLGAVQAVLAGRSYPQPAARAAYRAIFTDPPAPHYVYSSGTRPPGSGPAGPVNGLR